MTTPTTLSDILATTALFAALLLAAAAGLVSNARADDNANTALINSLPAQIPEILTGGTWSNGDVGGVYRAVVVMSDIEGKAGIADKAKEENQAALTPDQLSTRKAEVYIQWIANRSHSAPSKIVKTVSIREFNEKQLRHAFLAMDTLKDNEVTLLVTSYDELKDADVSISIKATSPGVYEPAK